MPLNKLQEADWDHWLAMLETEGVNLTSWEVDFLDSLRDQRRQGRRLSDRHSEILERIYSFHVWVARTSLAERIP